MSERFVTIGKLKACTTNGLVNVWTVMIENHHGDVVQFETEFRPPPLGTTFEIRVTECGDYYGTG